MHPSFLLNTGKVKKDLLPIFSVINNSSVLPILGSVLIKNLHKKLMFQATDLENTVSLYHEPEHIEGEISMCLNATKFKKILHNSLSDVVSFSPVKDRVKIDSGDFSLGCEIDSYEKFPKSFALDGPLEITVDVKEIKSLLSNALGFASNDDLRPSMTGVLLQDIEGSLMIVATDAHRLYFKELIKTPKSFKGVKAIIPKKGVRLFLLGFLSGQVEIIVDQAHIQFKNDSLSLVSRLIDATYPDWQKVVPANDLDFYMQRKNLLAFLKIAEPFVNNTTRQITFTINKNGISISGGDTDFGDEIKYKMPIYNGSREFSPFRFALNLKWLMHIASLSKDEYCKFNHSCLPHKGMIIDDNSLLMPVMLNDVD